MTKKETELRRENITLKKENDLLRSISHEHDKFLNTLKETLSDALADDNVEQAAISIIKVLDGK